MRKLGKFALVLLVTIMTCVGCGRVAEDDSARILPETEAQAIALVSKYFEKPETRAFIVEPDPVLINDNKFIVVKVSGILEDSEYPMDTFAVAVDSERQFFYSQETGQYVEFTGVPLFACAESPDKKYRAESAGMSEGTVSGCVSLKEMRIINLENGEIVWSDEGFLNNKFLWSPDGNYLAIRYSGRTWTETKVIETRTWSEIQNPNIDGLLLVTGQDTTLADQGIIKIEPEKWETDNLLSLKAEWDTSEGNRISGEFQYDVQTHVYSDPEFERVLAG